MSFEPTQTTIAGGKRICNSLAGSYKLRTNVAGVHYNTSGHSGSRIQKQIFNESNRIIEKMEAKRKRKCNRNAIARKDKPKKFVTDEPPKKKKRKQYYADGHEELDLSEARFEVAKTRFQNRYRENQIDRINIETETRSQPHSFRWIEVRKLLLTSSYFGRILKARSRHSYTNIVDEIMYKNLQYANSADMRHQRIYEKEALQIFAEVYPFEPINRCGIFIDETLSYLGTSANFLYSNDNTQRETIPLR